MWPDNRYPRYLLYLPLLQEEALEYHEITAGTLPYRSVAFFLFVFFVWLHSSLRLSRSEPA